MQELRKTILEQQYVYESDETGEYCTADVILDITEMNEIVTIKPQQNMTLAEIGRVLHGFEADVLKKMHMKLDATYPAQLEYKNQAFKIAFDENHNVKGITPL